MARNERPNILFILSDEQRADCLGTAGNREISTPTIDRLAAEGVRYDNMYCTLPICTPSRYSILSGLHVHQHQGWNNRSTLSTRIPTFPRTLRESGYDTASVGKMHFTPTYLDVGFDRLTLAEQAGQGKYDDDYHRYLRQHGRFDHLDFMDQDFVARPNAPEAYWKSAGTAVSELPEEYHSTTWIGDRAVEEISRWSESDDPNLLMVGFIKPHHPFDAPKRWAELYDPRKTSLLPGYTSECLPIELAYRDSHHWDPNRLKEPQLRAITAMYYAMISQIDYQVSRIVDALKQQGEYENTMIIYTSDHGEYLGFHHLLAKGNRMYDPVVRVPLIIKYPETASTDEQSQAAGGEYPAPGTANDRLFSMIDIFPTIAGAAGCDTPEELPGIDLADERNRNGREAVFAEVYRGKEYMVRTKEHKLLKHRDPEQSLLLDLTDDPYEMKDRIDDASYESVRDQLEDRLSRWLFFDTLAPAYSNKDEPVAPCARELPLDQSTRREMEQYFYEHMDDAGAAVFGAHSTNRSDR